MKQITIKIRSKLHKYDKSINHFDQLNRKGIKMYVCILFCTPVYNLLRGSLMNQESLATDYQHITTINISI